MAAAAIFGVLALGAGLGIRAGVVAVIAVGFAALLMARLCVKYVGGQTGDVLGAVEQLVEIIVVLTAAANA